MNRRRLLALLVPFALALATAPLRADSGEHKTFTRSFPFAGDRDIRVGIKVGPVSIDSFRIRNWPDDDDIAKGERDHGDNTTMVVEFTYTNRDDDHDYKCKYVVRVPGGGGEVWAENDREATLDKGKTGDTNKMFVKMKTRYFKQARSFQVKYEIWPD